MVHASSNKMVFIILAFVIAGLLYKLSPILTPFLVGILLAYLIDPLVNLLVRFRVPRVLSVVIIFLGLILVIAVSIVLLIPIINNQIDTLAIVIPNMVTWWQDTIIPWLKHFGINVEMINVATLKTMLTDNWVKAGGFADIVLKELVHSGFKVLEWMLNLILIPVVMFYLLCDWDKFLAGIRSLIPRNIEPTVVRLVTECDTVLSAFFRGQLLVMLVLGLIYSVGLALVGLQISFIVGLVAGLFSIVPYLGFIVGVTVASIASYVQDGSLMSVGLVWLVFIVGHVIEHMVLTPKLVGDRIGLHPVAVIFAILAGGCLFGFPGILLALPVAAVIMVWIRYLHQRYFKSKLYQR